MTKIEWTNITWNPVIGCSKVSSGCKNCYAEVISRRLAPMKGKWSSDYKQIVNDKGRFNGKIIYRPEVEIKSKKPAMVFVNSMSDFFHEKISDEIRIRLIGIMEYHKQHTFQILTKRPKIANKFCSNYGKNLPDNIWLGVSVENKENLWRMEVLKDLPAKIKFISFEPLLEDIGNVNLTGINWVIVGGESGINRRPFNLDWARNILRQCREQNIAFFMKQIDKVQTIPDDLMVREYP